MSIHSYESVWVEDAQKLDINDIEIDNFLARTSAIDDFMQKNKLAIIAPKGYGKTLLLKLKHKYYRDNYSDSIFVPNATQLDSFDLKLAIPHKNIDILKEDNIWEKLWIIALGTSAILNYFVDDSGRSLLDFRSDLIKICKELHEYRKNTVDIIDRIIEHGKLSLYKKVLTNPSFILRTLLFDNMQHNLAAIDRLATEVYQYCLVIKQPIVMFIDRIDQAFEQYPSVIWEKTQVGLIEAIFAITSSSSQLKIHASIRKEALANYQDVLLANYQSIMSNLEYSESELKEIFQNAIRYYEKINALEPINEFVSLKKVNNAWSKEEDIFRYIYRHTFQRPRDFIAIGNSIHKEITRQNYDESVFIDIVNKVPAISIEKQYLNEIEKFTWFISDVIDDPCFYANINTNVLEYETLVEICEYYNLSKGKVVKCNAKESGSCEGCDGANHIFSELYKIGLIGVVKFDETKNQYIQHFEIAGNISAKNLPISKYYLLHPAMDYYIKGLQGNANYMPIKKIKVGYKCIWQDEYEAYVIIDLIKNKLSYALNSSLDSKLNNLYNAFDEHDATLINTICKDIQDDITQSMPIDNQIRSQIHDSLETISAIAQRLYN